MDPYQYRWRHGYRNCYSTDPQRCIWFGDIVAIARRRCADAVAAGVADARDDHVCGECDAFEIAAAQMIVIPLFLTTLVTLTLAHVFV